MRNWSKSFVKWNVALDQYRGPFLPGESTCSPLITVNTNTGVVTYAIDYYTLGHFSKFILPGATQVYSSNAPGLVSSAFINPDGTFAFVAYNDSATARTFQVVWEDRSFPYTLPALAGATFTWSNAAPTVRRMSVEALPPRTSYTRGSAVFAQNANQQIQASSYNQVANLFTEVTGDVDGGFDLGNASNGSWAEYENVEFGPGLSAVDVRVAAGAGYGGTLEFHLDSVNGPIVAKPTIPVTGDWQIWETVTTPVTAASGIHNLFVVYTTGTVGNLNWFRFH
jgi:glucosylceramidase